jgi:hypothetical protein
MTKAVTPSDGAQYLICKYGKYYRPNAQGYTGNVAEAGRYTLAEAIRHSHPNGPDVPRDGIDYMPAPVQAHSLPREVGTVSAVDAFEMGFSFGMSMRGQTLEDSRAVGRLLYSDMFKSIAPQIENAINEQGFDSFQNADSGMCQAKRIIRAALTPSALGGANG